MKLCSKCNTNPPKTNQRYCKSCHAEYMKDNRPKYDQLSEAQKQRNAARAYANTYKRRGKLIPQPCKCGSPDAEMHHSDYSKPLDITWLCRPCHMAEHNH